MCAATNGGYGVYARNWYAATRVSPSKVNYTMDVWLRDQYGNTGAGHLNDAIARVRYRYTFRRSSVSLWALVTTYAAPNAAGTPFVKEPKFTALTRGGGFTRMSVFEGPDGRAFNIAVAGGDPKGTAVLEYRSCARRCAQASSVGLRDRARRKVTPGARRRDRA